MAAQKAILLANAAVSGAFVHFTGGFANFDVQATAWAGATVTLMKQGPNGAELEVAGSAATSNKSIPLYLAAGDYKAVITGGPPTAVYADLNPVPNFA